MTSPQMSSPGASSYTSSHAFVQPRHNNRPSYVQRWKVLRERNKSLPKLDFNAKASGLPKKFQGPGSFSRSYTYNSMKLPSISTCSIVTGYSGKTVHSDGYRRKDSTDRKNLQVSLHFERWKYYQPAQQKVGNRCTGDSYDLKQDQHSESYTDLSVQREYHDLAAALSKSLQSLVQEETRQTEQPKNPKSNDGHRYENISYKKHLLKRQKGTEATDKSKRSKGTYAKNKFEKEQFQKSKDREYVFVRNHTQNSPGLRAKNEKIDDAYKKVQKNFHTTNYPTSPRTDDFSKRSDTVTVTPDDVTAYSPVTNATTKSNITYCKSPVNMFSPYPFDTV